MMLGYDLPHPRRAYSITDYADPNHYDTKPALRMRQRGRHDNSENRECQAEKHCSKGDDEGVEKIDMKLGVEKGFPRIRRACLSYLSCLAAFPLTRTTTLSSRQSERGFA